MRVPLVAFGVIVVVIVAFVVVSLLPKQEMDRISGGKPSSPLGVELLVEDSSLIVGETAKITLRAFIRDWVLARFSDAKETNVTMIFNLPNNLEYVSGDLNWQGDIEGNQVKEIGVIVRAKETGYVKVSGSAISYQGTSYWGGANSKNVCIVKSPEQSCAEQIINETAESEVTYIGNTEPPLNPETGGKK